MTKVTKLVLDFCPRIDIEGITDKIAQSIMQKPKSRIMITRESAEISRLPAFFISRISSTFI
jgi:hypothetical protein